jgi:Na+-driven multidrug efflux pump
MITVFLHFIAGSLGALVVFLVFTRLSGVTRFSAPFGLIVYGIVCAALAHILSPWATPAILAIYALVSAGELYQERKERKDWDLKNDDAKG